MVAGVSGWHVAALVVAVKCPALSDVFCHDFYLKFRQKGPGEQERNSRPLLLLSILNGGLLDGVWIPAFDQIKPECRWSVAGALYLDPPDIICSRGSVDTGEHSFGF